MKRVIVDLIHSLISYIWFVNNNLNYKNSKLIVIILFSFDNNKLLFFHYFCYYFLIIYKYSFFVPFIFRKIFLNAKWWRGCKIFLWKKLGSFCLILREIKFWRKKHFLLKIVLCLNIWYYSFNIHILNGIQILYILSMENLETIVIIIINIVSLIFKIWR